jgi:hypothetical protein
MSLITVSALTREELLATSARRWDALRLARPDLVPAVDLQQRLLTIVADTAHAIGRSRLPRLSLPPKYLAAKLARGVPVFAGEPIPVPLRPASRIAAEALRCARRGRRRRFRGPHPGRDRERQHGSGLAAHCVADA